jgi:hypothetical protein
MSKFLSIETAKKLQEWGCNVESQYCWKPDIFGNKSWIIVEYPEENFFPKTYDLLEIISDGEMAKEFFRGRRVCENCGNKYETCECNFKVNPLMGMQSSSIIILFLLQQNRQQEAEEYLLETCVWNPKNK